MKAPAFLFERASRRTGRVAKKRSRRPKPTSSGWDPIDEQLASLLETVSAENETQAAVIEPDVRPDRVVARTEPPATAPPKAARPHRPARSTRKRAARRPDYRFSETVREAVYRTRAARRPDYRFSATVREALSGFAVELPRPYVPYTVRMAFSWLAVALFSIAVGFLIYLISA